MHFSRTPALLLHRGPRHGFTLIELLTVIAIIGILAAIIIPTIGRVRASARQTQGLSNLRQIGTAVELYAGDNKNRFPPGQIRSGSAATIYPLALRPYVSGRGSTFANSNGAAASELFKDPSAKFPDLGTFHFSANPSFMPDFATTVNLVQRTVATRPTQQVLLADGCQVTNGTTGGDSTVTLYSVTGIFNRVGGNSDNPVARGPDTDASSGVGGQLRWRASGGDAVKCLWVDGHVSVMRHGTLLQRHFQRD